VALLSRMGAVFALSLTGAMIANNDQEPADSAPATSHISRVVSIGSVSGQAHAPALIAMTSAEPAQKDEGLLDLAFGDRAVLGGFAQGSDHAPMLGSSFSSMAAAPLPEPKGAPLQIAEAAPSRAVDTPPSPVRLRPRAAKRLPIAVAAPAQDMGLLHRLFAPKEPGREGTLAYAPLETGGLSGWPIVPSRRGDFGERTATYDISTRTVTLPNGERLEAHSGLGDLMDDPRSKHIKNRGVTPPNVYTLRLREQLFHGVKAIRLTPINENRMFGRDGILAHSFMLGPRGDSNGCVSFRDYDAFLNAFLRGQITRLVVAENASAMLAMAEAGR
jgi:hypothetical protein